MQVTSPIQPIQAQFKLSYANFSLDVDLLIPGRGVTALFGSSGSGKTTLLRCFAGLERGLHGHLQIGSEVWQNDKICIPTHQRPLGYVFQEASLFPHLTVQRNLQYGLKRIKPAQRQLSLEYAVGLLGIEHLLDRMPDRLSGGEKQRVAIARALAVSPRLLLMDEPLAALDYKRKQEILPYLQRLHDELEIPVLYISHSQDEVARLADHVVVLQQGRAVAQGRIGDVFSRLDVPLPVGSDVGVIWQGEVRERNEKWHLARIACAGGDLWVRDTGDAVGQRIRVRILARDVSLTLTCHEDSSILNRLPVDVLEIATDCDAAMALVRLQAGNDFVTAQLTCRSVDHLKLAPGLRLWAQIMSIAILR